MRIGSFGGDGFARLHVQPGQTLSIEDPNVVPPIYIYNGATALFPAAVSFSNLMFSEPGTQLSTITSLTLQYSAFFVVYDPLRIDNIVMTHSSVISVCIDYFPIQYLIIFYS